MVQKDNDPKHGSKSTQIQKKRKYPEPRLQPNRDAGLMFGLKIQEASFELITVKGGLTVKSNSSLPSYTGTVNVFNVFYFKFIHYDQLIQKTKLLTCDHCHVLASGCGSIQIFYSRKNSITIL